jgi:hypothetical protein
MFENHIPDKISSLLKFILFFFVTTLLFQIAVNEFNLSSPFLRYTFEDTFADWFKVMDALKIVNTWKGVNPYGIIGINHMPPVAIAEYVLMALAIKYLHITKAIAYVVVIIIPLFLIIYKKKHFVNKSGFWYLILASYPVICMLRTGNISTMVFFCLVLFVINVKNIPVSMLVLSLAISIKITPILFFIYFIIHHRNNWKTILKGGAFLILYLFVFNLLSIWLISTFVSPDIYTASKFFTSVQHYENLYIYQWLGLAQGSSFYMAFRFIVSQAVKVTNLSLLKTILLIKPLLVNLTVILLITIIYVLKFSFKKFFETITDEEVVLKLVCYCFVLFTPVLADYYLCVMLLPLMFIPYSHFTKTEKVIFLLLLIDKNYIGKNTFSFQVLINPLLLLTLFLITTEIISIPNRVRSSLNTARA